MLRQLRNYRFNPFTVASTAATITNEYHAVPADGTYWTRLFEVPDSTYSHSTSGTPLYIVNTSGTVFTEVSSSPGFNEFRVDYTYNTGWVEFNSGNADQIIKASYRGTGSTITAEMINWLQRIHPVTPFFGGDGSDGVKTISTNTYLAEAPAGQEFVLKQYTDLTINTGITLGVASGCRGLVLCVQGRLKIEGTGKISVIQRGALGGVGAVGQDGAFGGGGGGGWNETENKDPGKDGGGAAADHSIPGPGKKGVGSTLAGTAGTNTIIADTLYWQALANVMLYSSGGGASGGKYASYRLDGGTGAGFMIIQCNVLDLTGSAVLEAIGENGLNGVQYYSGGSGGGAGGSIFIAANHIVGGTAATVESSLCFVGGGTGGAGDGNKGKAGGDGADGFKKVIELSEYNVY